MTNTNTPDEFTYSVGTSETGSFVSFATLSEASAEADDWARSEPTVTVYIWALGENGQVIETVGSYRY